VRSHAVRCRSDEEAVAHVLPASGDVSNSAMARMLARTPEADDAAAPEVAATRIEGASQRYDRGSLAYQLGDFKHAYDCFVQAYDLKPAADLVYNQAASLDMLGNTDAAVQAYERIKRLRHRDLKRP
jgi:tetratricopeptide (TPR) repeat protein